MVYDKKSDAYTAPVIDKDDMLFIRACKHNGDIEKRLASVYARTYLTAKKHVTDWHIAHALREVIEKVNPLSTDKLFSLISQNITSQEMKARFGDGEAKLRFDNVILNALILHLRFMSGDKFPEEMIWGLRWRESARANKA